ncbi:hypothetical protein Y032_0107g3813 [Ancylostoma ceylanicum]|uniref:Uncharacterized protein n=1 Tax=Ancylostoma ceylanicum TaxID=53326 RepID=A0A016TFR7_9BILA|nr:hypothetical protein Y032_0107g3813 [Ancylostoma ceylanicum]
MKCQLIRMATVVSVAVVNVDLDQVGSEGNDELIRSKQQATALVKNACQYAVDGGEVVATTTDTKQPVAVAVVRTGSTQTIATEQQENVVSPNTLDEQQRSAISKLDDVLDTASLPRSQITSTSASRTQPTPSGLAEADTSSRHSSKRSSRSRRTRGSRSTRRRRTKSRSGSSRSKRRSGSRRRRQRTPRQIGAYSHRRSKSRRSRSSKSSRSSRSRKACRCAIIAALEQGTHTESEKRDFAALLDCPKPYCKKCKELKKRLNIPSGKTCETECNFEVPRGIDQSARSSQREVKYKTTQPTMESMGVKFCTCLECSRYRQQGEIITPSRSERTAPPSRKQPPPGVKVTRFPRSPRKGTPECLYNLRKPRKGESRREYDLKNASPAGSLHSTFPINLQETKVPLSPYQTPQKRSIPIQRTPGTAGTQYWTPKAGSRSPSVRTARPALSPPVRTARSAVSPSLRTARPVISPGTSIRTARTGPSRVIPAQTAKYGQSSGISVQAAKPSPSPWRSVQAAKPGQSPGTSIQAAKPGPSPGISIQAAKSGPSPGISIQATKSGPSSGTSVQGAKPGQSLGTSAQAVKPGESPRTSMEAIKPGQSPGTSVQTAKPGLSPGISIQATKPVQSPGSSVRTARSGKSSGRWASWSRSRSTSSSSGRPQTPMVPAGRTSILSAPKEPQPSATISSKDRPRSFSQTSAGSSPGLAGASNNIAPPKSMEQPAMQAGTYIPERDYNPVCNCTNCKNERRLREENDVCDCYDCITEMRTTISAGKTSSRKSSASPHPPLRMKAEYTWVKKLLKIQQPAGRYHTPNEKRVEYPWQKTSATPSQVHSHQNGGGTSRNRSSSSHHGISTPSASQHSQSSSVATGGSQSSSQAEPVKQREESVSGPRSENKSTSSAATFNTSSPYVTPRSTRKSTRSTKKSSRSTRKSTRSRRSRRAGKPRWPSSSDESESWSEPEQQSGSYRTPRSRSQRQRFFSHILVFGNEHFFRRSKKRKPWR